MAISSPVEAWQTPKTKGVVSSFLCMSISPCRTTHVLVQTGRCPKRVKSIDILQNAGRGECPFYRLVEHILLHTTSTRREYAWRGFLFSDTNSRMALKKLFKVSIWFLVKASFTNISLIIKEINLPLRMENDLESKEQDTKWRLKSVSERPRKVCVWNVPLKKTRLFETIIKALNCPVQDVITITITITTLKVILQVKVRGKNLVQSPKLWFNGRDAPLQDWSLPIARSWRRLLFFERD